MLGVKPRGKSSSSMTEKVGNLGTKTSSTRKENRHGDLSSHTETSAHCDKTPCRCTCIFCTWLPKRSGTRRNHPSNLPSGTTEDAEIDGTPALTDGTTGHVLHARKGRMQPVSYFLRLPLALGWAALGFLSCAFFTRTGSVGRSALGFAAAGAMPFSSKVKMRAE